MINSEQLFSLALKVRENAYAPYSGFAVGAAAVGASGRIYGGCNVENAAYPCGTCAEAGALAAMVAGGDKKLAAILIVADTPHILPCGNCLQKIAELADADTLIYCADLNGVHHTYRVSELLPNNFSAEDIRS